MRERPQALLPYYSNKKEKLPVLKAAAVRENLAKIFLLTNFAEHGTIKAHKAYHKTVGGSLPHQPWSFDERGSNIFLPSPISLQGDIEGVAEGELRNLERLARSARITYSGGYAHLDDS